MAGCSFLLLICVSALTQKKPADAEQSAQVTEAVVKTQGRDLEIQEDHGVVIFANSPTEMEPLPLHSASWKAELPYALNG